MVQESTIVIIDNSEFMRNGDFSPSRFEAQHDAVNLICGAKIRQNAENTVGLISSAGKAVEVCATLTTDPARMLAAFHKIKIVGESDFLGAIQVAALALRHRQNKRQEQRIIIFVGSPIQDSAEQLKKVGAMLRKNKVAVDIVNFGEENAEANVEALQAFHNAVNNRDNSYLITIPPGHSQLTEAIVSTPIIRVSGGDAEGSQGAVPEGMEFGIDANMDPELLMALRLSMETAEQEARARHPNDPKGDTAMADHQPQATPQQQPQHEDLGLGGMDGFDEDMDPELAQALALSLQTANEDRARDDPEDAMETDEKNTEQATNDNKKEKADSADVDISNSDYMASVLLNLPGVDPNDSSVQEVIKNLKEGEKKDKEEKK